MRTHAFYSVALFIPLTLSLVLAGCGTSPNHMSRVCPANTTCGCGVVNNNVCIGDSIPLLYASTTSNQILVFSISSSGTLTALPSASGPSNSASVSSVSNVLMFADTSNNTIDSVAVNQATGALTPIQGSPFSLGAPGGGPIMMLVGPYAYVYATEPNGTIVGFGTTSLVGALGAPLPNSPYAAGVAPSQMSFAGEEPTGAFFLYASDPGDPNGGILAYSLDYNGSLTPVQGSPFPTLPNANPSFVLYGAYIATAGNSGTQFLFVSLTNLGKVAVFSIDTNTGALTAVPGSPFAVGNGPGILLEDDFNHVFVMNGSDHTISAFNLSSNGALSPIGSPVPVGTANGGMAYFPWNQLYVADTTASAIWTLNIDPTTGMLTQAGSPLMVSSPPLQLTFVGP